MSDQMISYWVTVGALMLIGAYWLFIRILRRKVRAQTPSPSDDKRFSDAELERYARHIMLKEIGGPGQKALKEARVLVIGAGGLGAPVLQYLAASGVGTLGVIDDDVVDASNLQRQVIHTDARIDMPKVFSAKLALEAQNPFVTVKPYQRRFDEESAALFGEYDLIIDGCDNFETRALVGRLCKEAGKLLISGAITQWEGQVAVFGPDGPSYGEVFPNAPDPKLIPSCAEAGVAAALPGVIGSMMALEAIKVMTSAGEPLTGRMMIYDGLTAQARVFKL